MQPFSFAPLTLLTVLCGTCFWVGCSGHAVEGATNAGAIGGSSSHTENTVTGGRSGEPSTTGSGTGGTALSGTTGTTSRCFSPVQNLDIAYANGSVGCTCNPAVDTGVCVEGVALICSSNRWQSVMDGPCMPQRGAFYSPSECTAAGGTPKASEAGAIYAATACASGVALGRIDSASSGWDEGGLCCAPDNFTRACGARAGDKCTTNEYCAYVEGQYCGAADAEAVCKPRPFDCPAVYTPVCGCNGKTYGSACAAAQAGVGVQSNGKCSVQ